MSIGWLILVLEALQGPVARPSTSSPWTNTLLLSTLVLVVLLIGIVVVIWFDRWRRQGEGPICTPQDQMSQFQQLYDRGELSQEEFDRIKRSLGAPVTGPQTAPPTASPNGSGAASPSNGSGK